VVILNQDLSVRSALVVATVLAHDGVRRDVVAIESVGATHLLAPAGASVRKPKNHPVEIIIHGR
jgi:outer membrane protein OmpA-like peptidoglycan-associated protein